MRDDMTSTWQQISESARQSRPVFVVGIPRSGTTVLRNTLEQHPRFRPREPGSVETKIFQKPALLDGILKGDGNHLLAFLLGDRQRAAELVRTVQTARDEGAGLADEQRLFFHFAALARGVERMIEKTPAHLSYWNQILSAFPDARIVATYRHPLDVYSSVRKKLVKAQKRGALNEGHRWLQQSPASFARRYQEQVDALSELRTSHPDAACLVSYERLTRTPRELLAEICAFLDEPFEEVLMFDAVEDDRRRDGSPKPQRRIGTNPKRWDSYLDPAEAAEVVKLTGAALETLGYPAYPGS